MEQPKQNTESPRSETAELEKLRLELAALKKTETEKKEKDEKYDLHFEEFEPGDLNEDDLRLYQRLKSNELTMDQLKQMQGGFKFSQRDYRQHILNNLPPEKTPQIKYNSSFLAWIINQASNMEYNKRPSGLEKRELEEEK